VLVCCYTNHALDQFLEDLLGQGIPEKDIVRLGSKPSPKTQNMGLAAQAYAYRFSRDDWDDIGIMKFSLRRQVDSLQNAYSKFIAPLSPRALLSYLDSADPTYFKALSIPPADDDMILVGESGRAIGHTYLISRWLNGQDAGVFREHPNVVARDVWDLSLEERKTLEARWGGEILEAQMELILEAGDQYNSYREPINHKFQESTRQVLSSKRIIACTTTGAAIYRDAINHLPPEILVVEEAGEVLECHTLTALSNSTRRMILIGDHKCVIIPPPSFGVWFADSMICTCRQLRPKVNDYELSVEKGDGYDLNRSLFERLVTEGHPYRALSKQHRMRPEISSLVRHLTYPDLTDGPGTASRPSIRGLQNTVIFVDHDHPEDEDASLTDPKYVGASTSKRNKFEQDMVVKIVKYLKQQGYGLDEITVLTPYLGQLIGLREALGTNDKVAVSEMDAEQLEVAGLSDLLKNLFLTDKKKQALKVATIGEFPRLLPKELQLTFWGYRQLSGRGK